MNKIKCDSLSKRPLKFRWADCDPHNSRRKRAAVNYHACVSELIKRVGGQLSHNSVSQGRQRQRLHTTLRSHFTREFGRGFNDSFLRSRFWFICNHVIGKYRARIQKFVEEQWGVKKVVTGIKRRFFAEGALFYQLPDFQPAFWPGPLLYRLPAFRPLVPVQPSRSFIKFHKDL